MNDNADSVDRKRYLALPPMLPPRGLHRGAGAAYIGVSPTKFDEMVRDGRMPQPKQVDGRRIWDRRALDAAFDALPDHTGRDSSRPWAVIP